MDIHKLYRPFLDYFRKERMREFSKVFQVDPQVSILDVGGDPFNRAFLDEAPSVIFVNLYARKGKGA